MSQPNPKVADQLSAKAEALQAQIDAKLRPAIGNRRQTARRAAIAASMRQDGYKLQKQQAALRALAHCHRIGTIPFRLSKVCGSGTIYTILNHEIWQTVPKVFQENLHSAGICDSMHFEEARCALLNLVEANRDVKAEAEQSKAEEIAKLERELIGMKIPGFFPTPAKLGAQIIKLAGIEAGMTVLEPSAGTGRLALQAMAVGGEVTAVEINGTLSKILELKGVNVHPWPDFMDQLDNRLAATFDRIVMNPPFENFADIHHVFKAFEAHLTPGGRLVAIMGESAFFRKENVPTQFRDWLEKLDATVITLPEGSFKESGTGVRCRVVVIDKPI